jgi:hypothetical protein
MLQSMVYTSEGLASIARRARKQCGVVREAGLEDIAKDTGCPDISPSCFAYPLPLCIYGYPPGKQSEVKVKYLESKLTQG